MKPLVVSFLGETAEQPGRQRFEVRPEGKAKFDFDGDGKQALVRVRLDIR